MLPPPRGLRTRRTPAYLRWRYGFEPLAYRALTVSDRLADGLAVFRLRRRGAATRVRAVRGAGAGRRIATSADVSMRAVARQSGADYVIRVGGPAMDLGGFVRAPRQGPILTWRPLARAAPGGRLGDWELGLGDVELF